MIGSISEKRNIFLAALGVLMIFSRVYEGAHWPLEGVCLGSYLAALIIRQFLTHYSVILMEYYGFESGLAQAHIDSGVASDLLFY